MTDLEGGLDEPAELQPAEGSLRLVGDDDTYDVTAWEAATAAVLRKARRLRDDAPDADVWAALTRTTLDGIEVAPIGQAADLDDLTTTGRPERAGAWDIRTPLAGEDAKAVNEAALVDLDNGATSLHLDLEPGTDLAAALRGVLLDLAPVTLERPDAEQSEALARLLEDTPARPAPRQQPVRGPGHGADVRRARRRRRAHRRRLLRRDRTPRPAPRRPRRGRRRHRTARPRGQRRPGARLDDGGRRALPPRAHRGRVHGRRGRVA